MNTMHAALYTRYGPPEVLHLQEIPRPTPNANELLVRVRAASVNYGDLLARNFGNTHPGEFNMPGLFYLLARLQFGWRSPKNPILGSAFAGQVEVVGESVSRFQPGDLVYGYLADKMGAYAEYVCLPEDGLVTRKPDGLSFEEAAALPYGALTALSLLKGMHLQPGQNVLILGASGSIGAAAVQVAKQLGARVTGVCGPGRTGYVQSLGADAVLDYTSQDYTQTTEKYDLVFDVLGKGSFEKIRGILTPTGRYLLASFKLKQLIQMALTARSNGQKVICALAPSGAEDFQAAAEWIAAGKFKAIIDRRFPLAQAAEAHRHAENGDRRGSVVLVV